MNIVLVHPLFLYSFVWFFVLILYSLKGSELLLFDVASVTEVVLLYIILPFYVFYALTKLFFFLAIGQKRQSERVLDVETFKFYLVKSYPFFKVLLVSWLVLSILEIYLSGGLPFIWLLTGISKTYFDFGIPSLHGLLNSLVLALWLYYFIFYLFTKKKLFLFFVLFFFLWGVLIISRQLIIVGMLQSIVAFLLIRKISLKSVISIFLLFLAFVVLFGVVGDFRSGADSFRMLAQPRGEYFSELPSGFLWVYIYVTTPLNNLVNSIMFAVPDWTFFENTISLLLPSVIRNFFFTGDQSGQLVTEAFNVSTAFVNPYLDLGIIGMVAYAGLHGILSAVLWKKLVMRPLYYSVMGGILILTIFFNHLMYLPVLFQFVWFSMSVFYVKSKF